MEFDMRFAAASSIANYITAGRNAAQAGASTFETARAFSPNYADLSTEQIKQDALTFAEKVRTEAETTQVGMKTKATIELAEIDAENAKTKAKYKTSMRKAGAIAAAGQFASKALRKPIERPEFDDGGLRDYYSGKMQGLEQEIAELKEKPLELFKPDETTSESTNTKSSSSKSSDKPISSAQALADGEDPSGGAVLGFNELRKHALNAGFSNEGATTMAAIALGESGGRVAIDTVQSRLDPNKSNEYSIGATQINVQAHGDKLRALGYSEDDLRDPVKNFQLAKMVYDEVGSFRPWSVYKSGDYLRYMPR